jgi:hypothetical protein
MKDVCQCGHAREEHMDTFLESCEVEECECLSFEDSQEVEEL